MNIAIIEYKKDIDEALRRFPGKDCVYLAVSAEGSYSLYERDIKFITDEDVLMPAEFKAIGDENFKIVEDWVNALEGALRVHNPILGEKTFWPFRSHFYRLKILMDAVRVRKAVLDRLIGNENPSSIGAPIAASPEKISDHHLFFSKYESLYGTLAERIAKDRKICLERWSPNIIGNDVKIRENGLCISMNRIGKMFGRLSALSNLVRRAEHNILVGNIDYDIEPLMRRLSNICRFYYYKGPSCVISLESFLKAKAAQLGNFPELHIDEIFNIKNITGDPIVDEILTARIKSYALRYIPALWNELLYIESVDSDKNFAAYIHHAGSSDSFKGIPIYYFTKKKKPVFIIQHGAYGFALNRHTEYCEFGHDGYFLGWGEGIKEMYEGRKQGNCEIISTGSSLIEDIRRKCKRKKKISKVCFVSKNLRGYVAYYPNGQPCLDSKLVLMEMDFLNILKPYMDRYEIIYKATPETANSFSVMGSNPILEWIGKEMPAMKIEYGLLTPMIHRFDLFILDFPATSLVQTLASRAEVLVYAGNPYFELSKEALRMLQKRAVVGIDEADFKKKMISILDKGVVVSDTEETSFLKKYGIHHDDGNSLGRMSDYCLTVIGRRPA